MLGLAVPKKGRLFSQLLRERKRGHIDLPPLVFVCVVVVIVVVVMCFAFPRSSCGLVSPKQATLLLFGQRDQASNRDCYDKDPFSVWMGGQSVER